LRAMLDGFDTGAEYRARAGNFNHQWDVEVNRVYTLEHGPLPSQGEVIGVVNEFARPTDVVLCAAGSLPGDLHKLWRARDPKGYHLEYGYSCMGYEIAGGLGAKMADPGREVYVMVGDGSYLMMNTEIVTAVQEGLKITVVLIDNHGFASIGGLSGAVGGQEFGTRYRYRAASGQLDGPPLLVDFAANARSLGAHVIQAKDIVSLQAALAEARQQTQTTVIVIETDREQRVGGYESWWDVPVAEVSELASTQAARAQYVEHKKKERHFFP